MENVESTTPTQDNPPQPPLSDAPVILRAECTDGNKIKLTWKLSEAAKSAVTKHQVTYTTVQPGRTAGRIIQEDIDGWERLTVENESVVFIKGLREKGVYTCIVQPVYGDSYGLASDPSEPVFTKEFLKQTEDDVARLKSCLSSSDLSTFDTSEKSKYKYEQIELENCDVGWLYNFHETKPESLNLNSGFVSKSFPDDTKAKLTIKDKITDNEAIIKFTYESYSETLINNADQLFLKTISDTTSTHYIASQMKGYEIIVSLKSMKGEQNQQQLEDVVKILKEGISVREEIFQDEMLFSVRGKIPKDYHVSNRKLTLDEFSELIKFTSEEFYVKIDSKPFTLSANIPPLNLVYYFSPFYEKLEDLKQKFGDNYRWNPWKQIIDFVWQETWTKIRKTAESIKQGRNCLREIMFLRQLLNSVLNQMEKMFQTFTEIVETEKSKFQSTVQISSDSNITAKVIINISLKEISCDLTKQFANLFASNFDKDIQNNICYSFNISLLQELDKTCKQSAIENQLLDICNNNRGEFSIIREMTMDNTDTSTSDYIFERNGNIINPKPPVFEKPLGLRTDTMENSHSVELSWNMQQHLATSFRVELNRGTSNSWETVSDYDNDKMHYIIPNLKGNTNYKFRVRAMYGDIPGMFTEVSHYMPQQRSDSSPEYGRHRFLWETETKLELPLLQMVWGSAAATKSSMLTVPCTKGDTFDKQHNFKSAYSGNCQFLEGKCRRRKHVLCDNCKEVFHFPHDDKEKLVELPNNWKDMKSLLEVKFDTRSKISGSCDIIKQTTSAVNNELKRIQKIMNYSLFPDTKSNSLIISLERDIDEMVIKTKPKIIAMINKLQDDYLAHVDNVQDYCLRTAVSLLLNKDIDLSTCKNGIITEAEEKSTEYKDKRAAKKDEIHNLYVISYEHTVKQYNGKLSEEIEVIFHKVPKFFERYEGMRILDDKSMLIDETIDELQEKCIDSVDKLSSSIKEDVELDRFLLETVEREDLKMEKEEEDRRDREEALRIAGAKWISYSYCNRCKTNRRNDMNWPYYCHRCDSYYNGEIKECNLCDECHDHFTVKPSKCTLCVKCLCA